MSAAEVLRPDVGARRCVLSSESAVGGWRAGRAAGCVDGAETRCAHRLHPQQRDPD